ncbi:hypothetical protein [Fulvivirga kasyanovii]|uniref:Uncharacterized protein n=1 Tax=Fulvivirga kasyanovii TaxID=396812 RepID=A0ABW9RQM7_9BACT|nr:hypothetical protein [Fulvivirga kasyanovii]MTI26293.1 hypothetical protein [Fulvivirga kasyanovii]
MKSKSNNATLKPESRCITRDMANRIIGTFCHMKGRVKREYDETQLDDSKPTCDIRDEIPSNNSYKSLFADQKDFNAFVFEREHIDRFFCEGATHLMIFLGAHPEKGDLGKPGSFTVVAAGCTIGGTTTNRETGEEETIYTSLDIDEPATQYPPKMGRSNLDSKHATGMIFFVKNK